MKRVIAFQSEQTSPPSLQVGDEIQAALSSSLALNGYHLLPNDPHDPDWTVHVQKEGSEFIVLLVYQVLSPDYYRVLSPSCWRISLENLNYQYLDDEKIQAQINPIINEVVINTPGVSNIVWYEDFQFLEGKKKTLSEKLRNFFNKNKRVVK